MKRKYLHIISGKGLVSRTYKKLYNNKKDEQPNLRMDKTFKQTFSKEDTETANKYMKAAQHHAS